MVGLYENKSAHTSSVTIRCKRGDGVDATEMVGVDLWVATFTVNEVDQVLADASLAHLGKTRRRDWVTGEKLAEQARPARIQSAPSEQANNEGTTSGSQRLLESNCGRDREGGGLW